MALTYNDVRNEIISAVNSDYRAGILWSRLHEKGAGYKDAQAYAIRVGTVTGNVLKKYQPEDISEWNLEDLIPGCLGLNHNMVAAACAEAQRELKRGNTGEDRHRDRAFRKAERCGCRGRGRGGCAGQTRGGPFACRNR